MFGVTLSDGTTSKHTYDDFGMRMTKCSIPKPQPKISKIDIPYASGSYDITEITGEVNYNNIEGIALEFKIYDGSYSKWEKIKSELASFIQGKKIELTLDSEPDFFYVARLMASFDKSNNTMSTIQLTGSAEPYKYAKKLLGEDWLWDEFDFNTGIIMNFKDVTVNNGKTVLLTTDSIYTVPEFVVKQSSNLAVVFNGKSYPMTTAKSYYFPQIRIGFDTTSLTFTGSGKLDINFRGRFL